MALVGANCSCTTTLLRAIAGAHRPYFRARSRFDGRRRDERSCSLIEAGCGLGIALVPEGRHLFPGDLTVEENLRAAAGQRGRPGPMNLDTVHGRLPTSLDPIARRAGFGVVRRRAAGDCDRTGPHGQIRGSFSSMRCLRVSPHKPSTLSTQSLVAPHGIREVDHPSWSNRISRRAMSASNCVSYACSRGKIGSSTVPLDELQSRATSANAYFGAPLRRGETSVS